MKSLKKVFESIYPEIQVISAIYQGYFVLFVAVIFLLNSCAFGSRAITRKQIASEILCPDGRSYMIRYAYANEVRDALRRDYIRRVNEKSNESYTAMKIPGMESFLIEQNTSEKLLKCQINQGLIRNIYPRYIRRFGNSPSSQFEVRSN